jgi:hypothetical protein
MLYLFCFTNVLTYTAWTIYWHVYINIKKTESFSYLDICLYLAIKFRINFHTSPKNSNVVLCCIIYIYLTHISGPVNIIQTWILQQFSQVYVHVKMLKNMAWVMYSYSIKIRNLLIVLEH